jgi:transposase
MSEIITAGLDLAKKGFQAYGADATGKAVFRKKLRRDIPTLLLFVQARKCIESAVKPNHGCRM